MSRFPDCRRREQNSNKNGSANDLFQYVVSPTLSARVIKLLCMAFASICKRTIVLDSDALPFHSLSSEKRKLLEAYICFHSHVTVLCHCLF